MRLKLKRVAQYGNSVMGQLWKEDPVTGTEEMLCDTLENSQYMIPAGEYRVDVTYSPKFRRLLPILCSVPGRSGIRIHAGNTYKDSTGCILVGKACGAALVGSRGMEERVRSTLSSSERVTLSVENAVLREETLINNYY